MVEVRSLCEVEKGVLGKGASAFPLSHGGQEKSRQGVNAMPWRERSICFQRRFRYPEELYPRSR